MHTPFRLLGKEQDTIEGGAHNRTKVLVFQGDANRRALLDFAVGFNGKSANP